jgi:hypothetical protein
MNSALGSNASVHCWSRWAISPFSLTSIFRASTKIMHNLFVFHDFVIFT